jgi:dGTP triphosphohydrolase
MECADDVAYAVHDLEDIVARRLVSMDEVLQALQGVFKEFGERIGSAQKWNPKRRLCTRSYGIASGFRTRSRRS